MGPQRNWNLSVLILAERLRWLRLPTLITIAVGGLSAGLHLWWMPHVRYDPLAPFRVLWMTVEGTYFPIVALLTWLAAKGNEVFATPFANCIVDRRTFANIAVALGLTLLLAVGMNWRGVVNVAALMVWLFLSLESSRLAPKDKFVTVIEWMGIALLFALASYAFTVFKAGLFYLVSAQDQAVVNVEGFLFGYPPLYSRIASIGSQLGDLSLRCLESIYFQLFSHMLLVSVFLGATGNFVERRRYVATMIISYLIGGPAYYFLPALGPVFFDPGSFAYIGEAAFVTRDIQDMLTRNTTAAQQGFLGLQVLDAYAFIACMPSLHMANEFVMLYFSRHSPVALLMSGLFFLASCAAVVLLGWHYLIDVPFGLVLGFFALRLGRRLTNEH